MDIQNITSRTLREEHRKLSVLQQIRTQSELTTRMYQKTIAALSVSMNENEAVVKVVTALLYDAASMDECIKYLMERGIALERAQTICATLFKELIGSSNDTLYPAHAWGQALLKQLRICDDKEGVLNYLESLVGAVSDFDKTDSATFPEPDAGGMYTPNDVVHVLRIRCAELPTQIIITITTHKYREYCATALGSVIDLDAQKSVFLEVLMVLIGLQSIQELKDYLEHSPLMSTDQGDKFFVTLQKTLFAELALYLPGMDADESESSRETIETCIARDVDVSTRLAKLPASVQAVIRSVPLKDAFASLQRRHAIDPDVVTHVGGQMVRVMVGLTSINDFKVQVARIMGIPPGDIDALCLDVEQNLFRPVRTAILHVLESVSDVPSAPEQKIADPYQAPSV